MREYISIGNHIAYWLVIIALLVVAIGSGLSQPPEPPGYSTNQTQSNNKDRSEQVNGEGSKTFRQRATEDPIAFFTFWLVIFTGILAFSTIGLWLVTGTAAKAARDSADALPKLERAYIFIEINPRIADNMRQWIANAMDQNEGEWVPTIPIAVNYQIANHGKTPAIIRSISAFVRHQGIIPEDITFSAKPQEREIVIASGEVYPARQEDYTSPFLSRGQPILPRYIPYQGITCIDAPFSADDAKSVRDGNSFLWFFGRIAYKDIFGSNWETRFCWRYNGPTNTFEQYDRPDGSLNRRT